MFISENGFVAQSLSVDPIFRKNLRLFPGIKSDISMTFLFILTLAFPGFSDLFLNFRTNGKDILIPKDDVGEKLLGSKHGRELLANQYGNKGMHFTMIKRNI